MDGQTVKILHNGITCTYAGIVGENVKKDEKNGMKQHGYHDASGMSIRIFTQDALSADVGDTVWTDGEPSRSNSMRVTEIHDNRRGVNPHYRIVCGR